MGVHVFVDNSNIYYGSKGAAAVREKHIPAHAVRVYYRHLFGLVEGGRQILTRVMAGSVPPGNDDLWAHAEACGYSTDLLRRVEADDGRYVEQGVDEMLHLKIANVILDYPKPQTLVLVTGDGKVSDFGTSFPLQAERALRWGWCVEVWSWHGALSNNFARLDPPVPEALVVRELDRYYPAITFVRAGVYRRDGKDVRVADRRVAALPAPAAP